MSNFNNNNVDNNIINVNNLNEQNILELLIKSKSEIKEERNLSENILNQIKTNQNFFEILLFIIFNKNNNIDYRLQAIIIMKNCIKQFLVGKKRGGTLNFSTNKKENNNFKFNNEHDEILNYLRDKFILYLSNGKFDDNSTILENIKQVIITLFDHFFPENCADFHNLYINFFNITIENFMSINYFLYGIYLTSILYSIFKNYSKKKTSFTKSKFYPFKETYINTYIKFYENINTLFQSNQNNFNEINIAKTCLNYMLIIDKILLKLIEISYNINTFHKDEKILQMIKIIIEKNYFLLKLLDNNNNNNKELNNIIQLNLYKNLKLLANLQYSNPILFYLELENYTKFIFLIIIHCEVFKINIIKICFYALSKIINTSTYKEINNIDYDENDKRNNLDISNLSKTPEKKRNCNNINSINNINNIKNSFSPLNLFLSPTKYRNFEKEVKHSKELFNNIFTKNNIEMLFNYLINKCPFIFKNEQEDIEIEMLSEFEEESNLNFDNFSTNLLTYQNLYKNLCENIIINFTEVSLNYLKDELNKLYNNNNNKNINYELLDSFFNIINLIPSLYKTNVITITEMIDASKYITFIEKHISNSNLILKKYIISLSKWSSILISNEKIFQYINNLIIILSKFDTNSVDDYLIIETCLSLKSIFDSMDSLLQNKENINLTINKTNFNHLIETNINFNDLFLITSNILYKILPKIESSELIVTLIKFFSLIIKKINIQNNNVIIINSKLLQITFNPKDEFTENVYIDMYKTLLLNFPDCKEILEMSLTFAEKILTNKINLNNLNFLLYILRCVNNTENNKKIIKEFINKNFILLFNLNKENLQNVLIYILEEFFLFDVFNKDENDIKNFYEIIIKKFKLTHEKFNDIYNKIINNEYLNLTQNSITNFQIYCADVSENLICLLDCVNSMILYYNNNNNNKININFNEILSLVFIECNFIINTINKNNNNYIRSDLITYLIELIDRFALCNFDCFKISLNNFIQNFNLNGEQFISNLFKLMTQTLKIEVRKMNVLFISKILPLFNYNFLFQNSKIIFDICLELVYIQKSKKILNNNNNENNNKIELINLYENLNGKNQIKNNNIINMSNRKKFLIENDIILKTYDIYDIFKQSIIICCNNIGKNINNFLEEINLVNNKTKEIFYE